MISDRPQKDLIDTVYKLSEQPKETEWLEFKQNHAVSNDKIGEYISALANSAALYGKPNAYMIWGIDDVTHNIIGTTFKPSQHKEGNEELESWLLRLLEPKINFKFFEFNINDKAIVLLKINPTFRNPVLFKGTDFIRIGSYKKKLKDHPEKARDLWKTLNNTPFESEIAKKNITADQVISLLDCPSYFELLKLPFPNGKDGILSALKADKMITYNDTGNWDVTNLGAVLFARKLSDFQSLEYKTIRVILYKGDNKVYTIREQEASKGYASGFEGLIKFITDMVPSNEIIGKALRDDVPTFPSLAIRELVANAIIHQDFHVKGTAPLIEIFSSRIEITNPGKPLIDTRRFLDEPPKSRNEAFAAFMRRAGVCEQRGSGIDKVVSETEKYQLPAPIFEATTEHTRTILFAHREFKNMDKADRIRACYLHSCLRYVERNFMTNKSLRERFGIEQKNSATVSRIIKDTINAGEIIPHDENASRKYMKYVPCWT
ncbi:MAG: putative DNA binding domain-containing protein [Thiomicrorhabdus sp.]|nr:putative DNA binding domain-containing protein [Thiomicrorhabdus sp.]